MKYVLISGLLGIAALLFCGCGSAVSESGEVTGAVGPPQTKAERAAAARRNKPLELSEAEVAAIARLKDRGAELEADKVGHVRIVELVGPEIGDADLEPIAALAQLESLDIADGKVSDDGLGRLNKLGTLQRLYLRNLPVGDKGMSHLVGLKNLEVLSLEGTRVTGKGLKQLDKLPRLQVLNLTGCGISGKDLESLRSCAGLQTLVLASTKVTGAGLPRLKPLRKLRVLNINKCQVTGPDLLVLKGFADLRMLYIHGCGITEKKETDELHDHNPMLAIFRK